jgi:hypothetical protein
MHSANSVCLCCVLYAAPLDITVNFQTEQLHIMQLQYLQLHVLQLLRVTLTCLPSSALTASVRLGSTVNDASTSNLPSALNCSHTMSYKLNTHTILSNDQQHK